MKFSEVKSSQAEPIKLPRSSWWLRVAVLAGAVAITVAVFVFWGTFADAYIKVLNMPPPAAAQPKEPVTVDIIPTKKKNP